jgi:two-component system chemotaxis response regulator CheB
VGVILSGYLDDGTAGLWAIKQCNGVTMVQDPSDALYPDMPAHALKYVQPDYVLLLSQIGTQLVTIVHEPAREWVPVPKHVALELKMMEKEIQKEDVKDWGTPISMSCPACGGPLRQLTEAEQPPRYRCLVGHGYTIRTLLEDQDEAVEQALWIALRTLAERGNMLENLAESESKNGRHKAAAAFEESAQTANRHAELLRTVLEKVHDR